MHYEAFCSVRNSHPSWSCETFNYFFFSYFRMFLILKSSSTPRHMHWSVFCCIFWGTIWKWALSLVTCLSYLVLCSVISCWLGFPGIIVKSPQLKKATALNLGLFSLCPGLETFSRQWTGLVRGCTSLVSYLSGKAVLWLVSNVLSAVASYILSKCFCRFRWQSKSHSIFLQLDQNQISP